MRCTMYPSASVQENLSASSVRAAAENPHCSVYWKGCIRRQAARSRSTVRRCTVPAENAASYSLFPWMTTRSNIAFGIKQARHDISRKERFQIADEFLGKVGLAEFGKKYPSQLSGGMQQRAAIARALAMNTEILLMDEPFSAIDAKNRVVLQELLLSLWEGDHKDKRKTVVFVTHDIDEAILLSDKIVVLTAHPGTVNEIVKVPFERPRSRAELVKTEAYGKFRNRLLSLLYQDVAARIGGEEVVL